MRRLLGTVCQTASSVLAFAPPAFTAVREMSELNPSLRRLQAALGRLETALDQHLLKVTDPGVLRAEVDALVKDRAGLAEALDQSLARERDLKQLADEASDALGAAIEEIRVALGSQEG